MKGMRVVILTFMILADIGIFYLIQQPIVPMPEKIFVFVVGIIVSYFCIEEVFDEDE